MTKFGTPTGAGPGRPRVRVGLSCVGDPSGRRMSPGLVRFFGFGLAGLPSGTNSPGESSLSVCGLSARVVAAVVGRRTRPAAGPVLHRLDRSAELRKLDRLGRCAGRHVDGRHDLLAADERDRDRAQLGERRERGHAKAGDEHATVSAPKRIFRLMLYNLASCPHTASPGARTLLQAGVTLPAAPSACNVEPFAACRQDAPVAAPCSNLGASHGAMIVGSARFRLT